MRENSRRRPCATANYSSSGSGFYDPPSARFARASWPTSRNLAFLFACCLALCSACSSQSSVNAQAPTSRPSPPTPPIEDLSEPSRVETIDGLEVVETVEERERRYAESPSDGSAAGAENGDATLGRMDAGHERMSRYIGDVADRVDRFFVDRRIDENLNRSRVRIRAGVRLSDVEDDAPVYNAKVNLRLPRITERLSLILSRTDNDEAVAASDRDEQTDDSTGLTLRYSFLDRAAIDVNADASMRWNNGPDPLLRLRARRDWGSRSFLARLTPSVFWAREDGAGLGTRLDLDRRFGPTRLGRLRNEIEFSESTTGVEFESGLLFFHTLDEKTGYRFRALVSGKSDLSKPINDYLVGFLYRRRIYSSWLYLLIEPRARFPRERDYDFAAETLFEFEAMFGEEYVEKARRLRRPAVPDSSLQASRFEF